MFGGKVEVEDVRARMDVLKRGSEVNAERIVGPRWPPAPMMITFLMREEDILDEICYLDQDEKYWEDVILILVFLITLLNIIV